MKKEGNYDFRRELNEVHKRDRRDENAVPRRMETVIDSSWSIELPAEPGRVIECAADDLQEYFRISMGLDLPLCRHRVPGRVIRLAVAPALKAKPRSYEWSVTSDAVAVTGKDPEGVGQGCYYLEDLMNLREAPFLRREKMLREPLFSPRMVHSGWGLDQFPDSHLNAIAHAGFDSVLLFVKGPDLTTHGFMDFNDLIDRCEKYGLGVYFYSYLPSFKHPDEPGAEDFFEQSYGSVFRHSPKAKGLILVGESCNFPSRDERTNGRDRRSNMGDKGVVSAGVIDHRPYPGFFPCRDYPEWLNAVKKAVRKYAPQADIVFWTYNWGRAPEELRRELIRNLPHDVALQATFEMCETITKYPNHQTMQPDYSITFPGPGRYFASEADEAHRNGLKLYTMANTAGRTWDFGTSPYVPAPFQWLRRFDAMRKAHEEWGLSGVMDCHHYGWFPSEVSECAKWSFWSPAVNAEEVLKKIARRDFGKTAAPFVLRAWKAWSRAMDSYTPGFDDQAGPLRIGPSYPFLFHPVLYPHADQKMVFPTTPQSPVGSQWLHAFYQPEHVYNMTNCGRRIREDIRILRHTLRLWEQGNTTMRQALGLVPEKRQLQAGKAAGVGFFCGCAIETMLHIKEFWLLNKRLECEYDFKRAEKILTEMTSVLLAEKQNVESAIPLAEADSRLGWEPSMDYMTDPWHLRWKLRQLESVLESTIPAYRKTLCKNPQM